MKKAFLLMIMIITVFSSLISAEEGWKDMSKGFQIQGGVGSVVDIAIEAVPAQSQNYRLGMPFNVEDVQVQSTNTGAGRKIAEWSLVANDSFVLGIKATKLKFDGTPTEGQDPEDLNYVVSFAYRLSNDSDTQYFRYNTETQSASITEGYSSRTNEVDTSDSEMRIVDILGDRYSDEFFVSNYIGILNENVYFKFTDSSSSIVDDDSLVPPGSYSAQVTLMIRSPE